MASPELLNFAQLRLPIADDNPAGKSLREDYSPQSLYQTLKDSQRAAREAERASRDEGGDFQSQLAASRAGWNSVLELAEKITKEESKDLQVVSFWTEALLRIHGFPGIRDGFRLARELIEEFWESLHPLPDKKGVATRVAPLAGLNGIGGDGVLINPIRNLPITEPGSLRALSLNDYKRASDLELIEDPEKREKQISRGAITLEAFQRVVAETRPEFFTDLLEDITACVTEFDTLCTVLDEKCGKGPDGHSLTPPSSNIRNALQDVQERVKQFVPNEEVNGNPPDEDQDQRGQPTPPDRGPMGPIGTREESFRKLQQVADFFRRTEPHSPISYMLDQAVRWGKLPLPELLNEMLPAESIPTQSFKLLGIRLPDRTEP